MYVWFSAIFPIILYQFILGSLYCNIFINIYISWKNSLYGKGTLKVGVVATVVEVEKKVQTWLVIMDESS